MNQIPHIQHTISLSQANSMYTQSQIGILIQNDTSNSCAYFTCNTCNWYKRFVHIKVQDLIYYYSQNTYNIMYTVVHCVYFLSLMSKMLLKMEWFVHQSSSSPSSGRAVCAAIVSSCSYFATRLGSMETSGGSRAGISTNSSIGSPISLRASHKNGFSKL